MDIIVAPSILSADFARLGEAVKRVEDGGCRMLHIDVMDGHFVPNLTIGPGVVKSLRGYSKMCFDVHLMIERPEQYVESFARAGADQITVHVEATKHLHRLVQQIKALKVRAGVALNPATPLEHVHYVLEEVDLVLLMTVNPGFGGQEFIRAMLPKIVVCSSLLEKVNPACLLQVDGGLTKDTAALAVTAGADILVAGSAVFGAEDPVQAMQEILLSAQMQSL